MKHGGHETIGIDVEEPFVRVVSTAQLPEVCHRASITGESHHRFWPRVLREGYVHGDIRGVNVAARQTQRLLVPVRSALGWAGMSFGKSRPHDARKVFQPCQAI